MPCQSASPHRAIGSGNAQGTTGSALIPPTLAPQPDVRRVQVIHAEDDIVLDLLPVYVPFVHAFLLDPGRPGADIPELGGTGRRHDRTISRAFVEKRPVRVLLAGGWTAGNVKQAVCEVRPFGLDLCSGVRTNDRLDPAKLDSFVDAAQAA